AEFIRLQCRAETAPLGLEEASRAMELLRRHGEAWSNGIPGLVRAHRFHRGFVEEGMATADEMRTLGPELVARAPVCRLDIASWSPWPRALDVEAVRTQVVWLRGLAGSARAEDLADSLLAADWPRLRRLEMHPFCPAPAVLLDFLRRLPS